MSVLFLVIGFTTSSFATFFVPFKRQRSNHAYEFEGRAPVTLESVVDLIHKNDFSTIEQVLGGLPQEFRNHYVLMYRSRSLQQSSFLAPRAILFEGDGTFALAFNSGHPGMRAGNVIETVQFREATKSWEFREITFFENRTPDISTANPQKCLNCHQSQTRTDVDPRPNWEPYNFWPGAYAGLDETIGYNLTPENRVVFPKLTAQDFPLIGENLQEPAMIEKFTQEIQPTHPRYRFLGRFEPRGVGDLVDLLTGLNDLRVVRLMKQTPDWDVYKDLLITGMFCKVPLEVYNERPVLPSIFLPAGLPKELLPFHEPLAIKWAEPQDLPLGELSVFHRVDLLFETRGINTVDWSMDYKTGARFAFDDRFGTPSSPVEQFQNAMVEMMDIEPDTACEDAKLRLTANSKRWKQSGRLTEIVDSTLDRIKNYQRTPGRVALMRHCSSCHETGTSGAPYIPFSNESQLRTALLQPMYSRGMQTTLIGEIAFRLRDFASTEEQMPPNRASAPEDRRALLDYLSSLY